MAEVFPSGEFHSSEFDPFIVAATWVVVEPHLEHALSRRGGDVNLVLQLLPIEGKPNVYQTKLIVLWETCDYTPTREYADQELQRLDAVFRGFPIEVNSIVHAGGCSSGSEASGLRTSDFASQMFRGNRPNTAWMRATFVRTLQSTALAKCLAAVTDQNFFIEREVNRRGTFYVTTQDILLKTTSTTSRQKFYWRVIFYIEPAGREGRESLWNVQYGVKLRFRYMRGSSKLHDVRIGDTDDVIGNYFPAGDTFLRESENALGKKPVAPLLELDEVITPLIYNAFFRK